MRVVHLYPFVPAGRHGGTLRLRAALAGSEAVGETEVHWYDAGRRRWQGPHAPAELDRLSPPGAEPPRGLKRALFPSTLWESGARLRRSLRAYLGQLGAGSRTTVLLHTTYLAPALGLVEATGAAGAIDVYDLVWRAHANDAGEAGQPRRALRRLYADTVRSREARALRGSRLIVAGWDDFEWIEARVASRARWIPTPAPVDEVRPLTDENGLLRVGLIGNFAHAPTLHSARRLLATPLAADPATRIVLAGRGSELAVTPAPGVQVIGEVDRVERFYEAVDCVVCPVGLGSGMKVKLAEAVAAGRPAITTALGAAGYPPELRRHLFVADPARVDRETVRRAIHAFDPAAARADVTRIAGAGAVARAYAEALTAGPPVTGRATRAGAPSGGGRPAR